MSEPRESPVLPKIRVEIVNILGGGECSRGHQVGDVFQYPRDRGKMCPSALQVLHPYLMILTFGGSNIYRPEDPNSFSVSCPDSTHPVVYKLTRMPE